MGACKSAGVGRSTLYEWLQRGRAGEEPYAKFAVRIREADGRVQTEVERALYEAATGGHVGAQSFWLERQYPRDWGKREAGQQAEPANDGKGADDLETARAVVAALESRKAG